MYSHLKVLYGGSDCDKQKIVAAFFCLTVTSVLLCLSLNVVLILSVL